MHLQPLHDTFTWGCRASHGMAVLSLLACISQRWLRQAVWPGQVRSIAADQTGQWLASGGDDGLLRLWEVRSGRCMRSWDLQAPIHCVAWCPNQAMRLLSAASASRVVLLPSGQPAPCHGLIPACHLLLPSACGPGASCQVIIQQPCKAHHVRRLLQALHCSFPFLLDACFALAGLVPEQQRSCSHRPLRMLINHHADCPLSWGMRQGWGCCAWHPADLDSPCSVAAKILCLLAQPCSKLLSELHA